MFPDNVESLAAEIHKVMELVRGFVPAVDDVDHVGCEDEGRSVPLEVSEHLGITQELAEVDVKQMAGLFHHDVVVVPVADAQDVRHDAVTGARS